MTFAWLVITWVGFPHFSQAQSEERSYRIRMDLINGARLKGWLLSSTDSTVNLLMVTGSKKDTAVMVRDIGEVSVRRRGAPGKGFGIGFGSGAAVGALIGYATYAPPNCGGNFFCLDLGPGVSAIGGAVFGAFGAGLVGLIGGSSYNKFVISGDPYRFNLFRTALLEKERKAQGSNRSRP